MRFVTLFFSLQTIASDWHANAFSKFQFPRCHWQSGVNNLAWINNLQYIKTLIVVNQSLCGTGFLKFIYVYAFTFDTFLSLGPFCGILFLLSFLYTFSFVYLSSLYIISFSIPLSWTTPVFRGKNPPPPPPPWGRIFGHLAEVEP